MLCMRMWCFADASNIYSALHAAGAGVAVADLSSMPPRQRQALLQALQLRSTPRPRDAPPELALPLTATAWAAGSWQEMCPAAGCDAFGRPATRKGAASSAAAAAALTGFDLVIADCTVHEEQVLAALDSTAAAAATAGARSSADKKQQQQHQAAAAACVRHLMAAATAACDGAMQLTDGAQAFLGAWERPDCGARGKRMQWQKCPRWQHAAAHSHVAAAAAAAAASSSSRRRRR